MVKLYQLHLQERTNIKILEQRWYISPPDTTSKVTSKSVSRANGRSTYRGLLKVAKGATNVKATVRCDALLLDDTAKTDTYPYMEIDQEDATVTHEATVGKIGDEQIFYLMSRGFLRR